MSPECAPKSYRTWTRFGASENTEAGGEKERAQCPSFTRTDGRVRGGTARPAEGPPPTLLFVSSSLFKFLEILLLVLLAKGTLVEKRALCPGQQASSELGHFIKMLVAVREAHSARPCTHPPSCLPVTSHTVSPAVIPAGPMSANSTTDTVFFTSRDIVEHGHSRPVPLGPLSGQSSEAPHPRPSPQGPSSPPRGQRRPEARPPNSLRVWEWILVCGLLGSQVLWVGLSWGVHRAQFPILKL